MSKPSHQVINVADAPSEGDGAGPWGSTWQVLTPTMRAQGGTLGMVQSTLPPGAVGCPFHWHLHEDEVFFVIRGRGVFRYGDDLREVGPGDCMSCPAGTRIAHQIANPFDEDLVYLAIGDHHPHEVCGYPDTGKVMVRALRTVGQLEPQAYMQGEPEPPKIFGLWQSAK